MYKTQFSSVSGQNLKLYLDSFILILEKALRAFASSSGGAAYPGGRGWGVGWGVNPGVREWSQGDLSEKKFCDGRMDTQTDVLVEIVM